MKDLFSLFFKQWWVATLFWLLTLMTFTGGMIFFKGNNFAGLSYKIHSFSVLWILITYILQKYYETGHSVRMGWIFATAFVLLIFLTYYFIFVYMNFRFSV